MAATNGTLAFDSFHNTIDNKLCSTPQTRHGIDPSNRNPLPEVPVARQQDVDEAVDAARKAFRPWASLSYDDRSKYIQKLADAIEAHGEDIKKWLALESGKPLQTAALELGLCLGLLRGHADLRLHEKVIEDNDDRRAVVRYVPLGVGCAIVPWNWPLVLCVGKVGPALMTGNTLIVKPSPFTPYVDLKVGELASKIFPPGVLQVLSGGDDLGPMLTEHTGIDKISFTGSTATGKLVMKSAASTLKRVTLELGGNDAAIICEDADLEKALPKIATMAFLSSGQICMNVKRIYVHEKVYDKFRDMLVEFVKQWKIGGASDEGVFIGPVQNSMQYDKVRDMFSNIGQQGWVPSCGGKVKDGEKGFFFEPTIIDNPPEKSSIVQEEPFGPIVPMLKWSDDDDVVARANDTKMGLGASVWTQDINRGETIQRQLEAGSVWINTHFELAPHVPFGGHKWSGIGMEWGEVGFKSWCNPQSLWLRKQM